MLQRRRDRPIPQRPNTREPVNRHGSDTRRDDSFLPGILVGDDDLWNRALLWAALTKQGFKVFLALDGEEALEIYGLHQNDISLLLLDVQMPVLDGPESLKVLRDFDPFVACCFMSRDLGAYTREDLSALTPLPFFDKPLRVIEMVKVLSQVAQDLNFSENERHRHQHLSNRSR